jgi:hypothetical protein
MFVFELWIFESIPEMKIWFQGVRIKVNLSSKNL